MQLDATKSYVRGRDIRPLNIGSITEDNMPEVLQDLKSAGITFFAQDSASIGPASTGGGPLYFRTTHWLNGRVYDITQVRAADELMGITVAGEWAQSAVVQKLTKFTGKAAPYGDAVNMPYADSNPDYLSRDIVQFTIAINVGKREEARAAYNLDNATEDKTRAAMESLEINRNKVALFGYSEGGNRTFGFFNDPNLPDIATLPAGASGFTSWATLTYDEIIKDLNLMVSNLIISSGRRVRKDTPMTLELPVGFEVYEGLQNQTGSQSVIGWLNITYPNLRLVYVPEAKGINGGENIATIFADKIEDSGTDNEAVIEQIVPAKLMPLNTVNTLTGWETAYVNATAGSALKRPYGVQRYTGL